MSLFTRLTRKLSGQPKSPPGFVLDPSQWEKTHRDYDEGRGYGRLLDASRAACRRAIEAAASLAPNGYRRLRVMEGAEAQALLDSGLRAANGALRRGTIDYSETLAIDDESYFDAVFDKAFTPAVDGALLASYGGEYFPYWYRLARALPDKEPRRAFLWHCDKGPTSFLKILLYLNPSSEHGGSTALLDRPATEAFAKAGYVFGPTSARQKDLSPLAAQFGIDYHPQRPEMGAGEAILFGPTNLLHAGVLPSRAPRYVLEIALLPSPLPWREALAKVRKFGPLPAQRDYAFADHANEILGLLTR